MPSHISTVGAGNSTQQSLSTLAKAAMKEGSLKARAEQGKDRPDTVALSDGVDKASPGLYDAAGHSVDKASPGLHDSTEDGLIDKASPGFYDSAGDDV